MNLTHFSRHTGLLLGFLAITVLPANGQDLRLVTAAAGQDSETARQLIDEGVDVNTSRADGATALLWATHWDDLDLVNRLLAAGADVNATDDHQVSALERAAENASLAMTKKLLSAGANANAAQTSGLTPLMTAAETGNVNVVKALLTHGAEVNAETFETKSTALMWAVAEQHTEIVQLLLTAGANARTSTEKGFTPLMFAAKTGNIELAKELIGSVVDIEVSNFSDTLTDENLSLIQEYVNTPSSDGTHVLPYAILSGQDIFALFLLNLGANPDASMNGIHALHAASGNVSLWLGEWYRRHGRGGLYAGLGQVQLRPHQRLPLVKALLAKGADPNARISTSAMIMSYIGYPTKGAFEPFACGTGDLSGATPLWVAAYEMNGTRGQAHIFAVMPSGATTSVEVLQTLLDAGADQHLTTDDGTTPFMAAAGLGVATYTPRQPRGIRAISSENAVKFLYEAGADINAVNEANFTALHGAAFRGMNEVIEYLVANGADIDARDFRGRTPFRMAEGSKQSFQFQSWPKTAELFAQLGANTRLGIPGTVQERLRDVPVDVEIDAQP